MKQVMSGAGSVPTHLAALAQSFRRGNLREAFAANPRRAGELSRTLGLGDCELLFDFSKQHVDHGVLDALLTAAADAGVFAERDRMFAGEPINATEQRAVTHAAMRASSDGASTPALRAAAEQSRRQIHDAVAATPASITHVVNLGIGGSDLGPALLCDALLSMRPALREARFASNIDPLDLDRALVGLSPQRTVFVMCSKSFGTTETLANARRAAEWLRAGKVADPAAHLIAVTSQPARIAASGLPVGTVLHMPESVGGRFSVSSAVSLAVALTFGVDVLQEVHEGMRMVDEHFVTEKPSGNVPLIMGLLWWWNSAVLGYPTVAVVPYSRALALLAPYLQQLMMESNGKSVGVDGRAVSASSPVVWGGVGTNAQHAFFQMLHQGTQVVPCEFIGHSAPLGSSSEDHDTLIANMIAQTQALAFGVSADEVGGDATLRAHRAMPGNRPSSTLLYSRLTPRAVGAILAQYEHATFVMGVMYGINSFDQWGVELGKQLANQVAKDLGGTTSGTHDSSTALLIDQHRRWRSVR